MGARNRTTAGQAMVGARAQNKLLRRDENAKPNNVSEIARSVPRKAWATVRWREGSKADLTSR